MSDSDWYARHLNRQPAPQQQPPPVMRDARLPGRPVPPQQAQAYAVPQYQQPPQQGVTQYPQGAQVGYPQQQPQQQVVQFAGHTYVTDGYQGGVGNQMNPNPCPQCGSNQYMEHVRTKGRGPEPAGHCYNCGYNELFDQGDSANWGSAGLVYDSGQAMLAPIQSSAPPPLNSMQV